MSTLSQAIPRQLGRSRTAQSESVFTAIVAGMVFLFCALSIVYLSHANAVATEGYKIKQLQEERTYLQAELDTWNLKLTRLQAIDALNKSEQVAQMVNFAEIPQFIERDTQVAFAQ